MKSEASARNIEQSLSDVTQDDSKYDYLCALILARFLRTR